MGDAAPELPGVGPASTGQNDPRGQPADPVLLAFYEGARTELLQRLKQRDETLVLFLGVVGLVFSAAFTNFVERYVLLLFVPYLGLGATFVSMEHNSLIGSLGRYCAVELGPWLDRVTGAPQWERSASRGKSSTMAFGHRVRAHLLLLVLPQVAALGCGMYGLVEHGPAPLAIVLTLAVVTALAPAYSVLLVKRSYDHRRLLALEMRPGG